MFEKWAVALADQIKKINPEETEPHDVLVFGFTILFNLLFTFLLLLIVGWIIGVPLLTVEVTLSFMILRILTGGAHLDRSIACSITSSLLVLTFVWLPVSPILLFCYFVASLLLIARFAPYYEPHQIKHSKQWEQKKKRAAILWVIFTFVIYYIFSSPGFVFGALLQALLLTPAGIKFIHKLNNFTMKGGEYYEKSS
ncbi:accessory gene regulator ArgB-like protein [Bacillus smithii]|uniref:accessory gene regulator ArgB-like protein n=1 Tax=Bacillus smithii TaxID=1479 RepID=UPI0030C9181B